MPPTGELDEYPFHGLFGCWQMLEAVGTGTQLLVVLDGFAEVVGLDGEVVGARQV
jgi:hypothetical protein